MSQRVRQNDQQIRNIVNNYLRKCTKEVHISADGTQEFTSIQDALDANPTEGVGFIVYPGTYTDDTINFTAENQVVLGNTSASEVIITTEDAQIVNYGSYSARLFNLKIQMTAPTTAKTMITGSGTLTTRFCNFTLTCTASISTITQPAIFNGTGKTYVRFGSINYTHSGSYASAIKVPIIEGTGSMVDLERVEVNINCSNTGLASSLAYGSSTGTVVFKRCDVVLNDSSSTLVIGYYDDNTSGESEIYQNHLKITIGTNTGYGIYMNGSTTIKSMYNHLSVESTSTGTCYSSHVSTTSTLYSHFDYVVADDGQSGTGTRKGAYSPSAGEFSCNEFNVDGVDFDDAAVAAVASRIPDQTSVDGNVKRYYLANSNYSGDWDIDLDDYLIGIYDFGRVIVHLQNNAYVNMEVAEYSLMRILGSGTEWQLSTAFGTNTKGLDLGSASISTTNLRITATYAGTYARVYLEIIKGAS